MMLNVTMDNEQKNFTNLSIFSEILVAHRSIYHHNLRKEIKIIA